MIIIKIILKSKHYKYLFLFIFFYQSFSYIYYLYNLLYMEIEKYYNDFILTYSFTYKEIQLQYSYTVYMRLFSTDERKLNFINYSKLKHICLDHYNIQLKKTIKMEENKSITNDEVTFFVVSKVEKLNPSNKRIKSFSITKNGNRNTNNIHESIEYRFINVKNKILLK